MGTRTRGLVVGLAMVAVGCSDEAADDTLPTPSTDTQPGSTSTTTDTSDDGSVSSSSQRSESCIGQDDAEVCLVAENGRVLLEAEGLQPGSDIEVTSKDAGSRSYPVRDDGRPDGVIGFLSAVPGPIAVDVIAVAADGGTISGQLRAGG